MQKTADLAILTKEILNGKLHFLCSVLRTACSNPYSYFNLS